MYVYVQLQIYIKPCFVFGFDVCVGYGVAMSSRLLKMIGLFCERALKKKPYSAKETCHFKEPTNRSHLIRERGCRITASGVMMQ